jgi:hypothetical protein
MLDRTVQGTVRFGDGSLDPIQRRGHHLAWAAG